MIDRHLVFVGPHAGGATIPSRPAAIWEALARSGAFRNSVRVERRRPDRFLAARMGREARPEKQPTEPVIAHPWPFGRLERRFLRALVERSAGPSVLWISDPKSAPVFRDIATLGRDHCLLVFDAYDAWDLSPLVRGRRRRAAVADGYDAAAEHAHLVFGNTPFVVARFRSWGAGNVVLLPNAAPSPAPWAKPPMPAAPFLLYAGRVHERLDAAILTAVAKAFPGIEVRIAGPVEREPAGWRAFVRSPNVRLLGPVPSDAARQMMAAAAACLVPHIVDDYSRSQDTMKAWDAISVGTPVISTGVPPTDGWGAELAIVADDPAAFIGAVHRVLGGEMTATREQRLEFAAANTWEIRAGLATAAIRRAINA